jgi:hypothetical protein
MYFGAFAFEKDCRAVEVADDAGGNKKSGKYNEDGTGVSAECFGKLLPAHNCRQQNVCRVLLKLADVAFIDSPQA